MPQDGPRNTLPVKVRGHREPRVSADNFLGELMKDVRRVSPVAVDVIARWRGSGGAPWHG